MLWLCFLPLGLSHYEFPKCAISLRIVVKLWNNSKLQDIVSGLGISNIQLSYNQMPMLYKERTRKREGNPGPGRTLSCYQLHNNNQQQSTKPPSSHYRYPFPLVTTTTTVDSPHEIDVELPVLGTMKTTQKSSSRRFWTYQISAEVRF